MYYAYPLPVFSQFSKTNEHVHTQYLRETNPKIRATQELNSFPLHPPYLMSNNKYKNEEQNVNTELDSQGHPIGCLTCLLPMMLYS